MSASGQQAVRSINFKAPPTGGRFARSNHPQRVIMGPVGSGKTTTMVFEMLRRAAQQDPAPDGIRYTRFAIVRNSLKDLKATVHNDVNDWLGPVITYKESTFTFTLKFGDVWSEWVMMPLANGEDVSKLLSLQLTGCWMSEGITMSPDVIGPINGRLGRFPGPKLGGCTWSGIFMDTNFPTEGSEWQKLFEDRSEDGQWEVYKQPGGLDDDAENLPWLKQTPRTLALGENHPERIAQGRSYYLDLVKKLQKTQPDWVHRYVHAKYGRDPSGTPVFREAFNEKVHVLYRAGKGERAIEVMRDQPLLVGQDFGRNPVSIIGQIGHTGQARILHEVPTVDLGLQQHILQHLRPALSRPEFIGLPVLVIGDPSGGAKNSHYEENSFDLLVDMGYPAIKAHTNFIEERLNAVRHFLNMMIRGEPAMVIDGDHCPLLVKALNGGYKYGLTAAGEGKPLPEKNHPDSDLADALQYWCLSAHSGQAQDRLVRIRQAKERQVRGRPRPPSSKAWAG